MYDAVLRGGGVWEVDNLRLFLERFPISLTVAFEPRSHNALSLWFYHFIVLRQRDDEQHRGCFPFAMCAVCVQVTPLGRVLCALPMDVGVGKTLVLGALVGLADLLLVLSACLTAQTPFQQKSSGGGGGGGPVRRPIPVAAAPGEVGAPLVPGVPGESAASSAFGAFFSSDGDPFCVLAAFDEWMRTKARDPRGGTSRHW